MFVLGLTGSIAMGKSTVAHMFAAQGIPVFDADAAVHDLLEEGGAGVDPVATAFPEVARAGTIDRAELGVIVFGQPERLEELERILHPLVAAARREFVGRARRQGRDLVVLDVPLLFETRGERYCDAVAVVSAPRFVQRRRLISRPGMTAELLSAILKRQMPDAKKRSRADFIIPTGVALEETRRQVRYLVRELRGQK